MIVRIWRGETTPANVDAYEAFLTDKLFPSLYAIPGHAGADLLRRPLSDSVEFLALTYWDSIACIQGFTGPNTEVAVIEPEARALLASFDDFARHYQVAHRGRHEDANGTRS